MDAIFKALADPTRRGLLDELFREDGQSLSALEVHLPMTRFGVMKHLKVLETAGLVVTRRRGREKLHFLNVVPIRLVHDRWVSKYSEPWAAALSELKNNIEETRMEKVFEIYIKMSHPGFDGDFDLARVSWSRQSGIRRRSVVVGVGSRTLLV